MEVRRPTVPRRGRVLTGLACVAALMTLSLAVPAVAQYSTDPPTPTPAKWGGRTWGVVDMQPKVVRPGDTAILEAALLDGGPATTGFYCSSGAGWRVQGTENVTLKYSSVCFELVDYEPKPSQYVKVSVGAYEVTWNGLSGDAPTASVARELNPNAGADCYCHVDWWGARGKTDGCNKPIGTFGQGQVFRLYLKARAVPTIRGASCSTAGKYTLNEMATFGGNYGPGWSDSAETYYRFDTTGAGGARPVPKITVAADPMTLPTDQTSTITAVVTDPASGKPMPGQKITFSTTIGTLNSSSEYADAKGQAAVVLSSDGKAGVAKVRAGVGGEEAAAYVSVEFTGPPATAGEPILRQYFAEGSTEAFFTTDLALVNPAEAPARATLTFMTPSGAPIEEVVTVPAHGRRSIRLNSDVAGLSKAAVSTLIESTVPIVADRTMTWDASGYGSHSETAVGGPRTTWYLAEGATHSGFSLFYLIQNPDTSPANVTVTYLRPAPLAPVFKSYTVAAQSRFNVWVNAEGPELASTDVSAVISASTPVIVERAMYMNSGGLLFGAGHESAGIAEPALKWFFAEGATGEYFDLFILVANPGETAAQARATYLLPDGSTVTRDLTVAPKSRFNIWVDLQDAKLANTAVSTVIESLNGVPLIAERAMWWPGSGWQEAHNAAGSTTTGTEWAIADGEQGGPRNLDTYVLIANTSETAAWVIVTIMFEDGTQLHRGFDIAARSRFNVSIGNEFPATSGRRFGVTVKSGASTPAALVVERAVYSNAKGMTWAAGSNALATKLK
jgi:hypothetical protein